MLRILLFSKTLFSKTLYVNNSNNKPQSHKLILNTVAP